MCCLVFPLPSSLHSYFQPSSPYHRLWLLHTLKHTFILLPRPDIPHISLRHAADSPTTPCTTFNRHTLSLLSHVYHFLTTSLLCLAAPPLSHASHSYLFSRRPVCLQRDVLRGHVHYQHNIANCSHSLQLRVSLSLSLSPFVMHFTSTIITRNEYKYILSIRSKQRPPPPSLNNRKYLFTPGTPDKWLTFVILTESQKKMYFHECNWTNCVCQIKDLDLSSHA